MKRSELKQIIREVIEEGKEILPKVKVKFVPIDITANKAVPIKTNMSRSAGDTSEVANKILEGYYVIIDEMNLTAYVINPDEVNYIDGLADFIKQGSGGTLKIGARTLKYPKFLNMTGDLIPNILILKAFMVEVDANYQVETFPRNNDRKLMARVSEEPVYGMGNVHVTSNHVASWTSNPEYPMNYIGRPTNESKMGAYGKTLPGKKMYAVLIGLSKEYFSDYDSGVVDLISQHGANGLKIQLDKYDSLVVKPGDQFHGDSFITK